MNESKLNRRVWLAPLVFTTALYVQAQQAPQAPLQSNDNGNSISEVPTAPVPAIPPQFTGSVPQGQVSPEPMDLRLTNALDRALRTNLGVVLGSEQSRAAQAQRLKELSNLLPNVTGRIDESAQQINLAAFGFPAPAGTSPIIGPFSLSEARGFVSQRIFDWNSLQKERSANAGESAARYSLADAREIVVLVVANLYLRAVASEARVAAAQSQLATAKTFYDQAQNMRTAGMVAGIDVLRAQVEMQARQQQLLFVSNEFAKEKLDLARAIGLPAGQEFNLVDKVPYAAAPFVDLNTALQHAFAQRADYQSALAALRSAELARSAARGEAYPSLRFDGNYGDIGRNFANSHGTFAAQASLDVPIFQGGKVRADVMSADALIAQRRAEAENLKGQIESDVRKAMLDVQSASDQVQVTQQELAIAQEALGQARDRFAAGVADNLEVVQAQEAVANANEAYISSVYAHNIAKASLARAVGVAEKSVKEFLGARP